MNSQKQLWEGLAKANSKYYVASFKGKDITEDEYSDSGWEDYKKHISRDELIKIENNFLESIIFPLKDCFNLFPTSVANFLEDTYKSVPYFL